MKRKPIQILKDKLWKTISLYVRLRDSDERGYCKCISCDKVRPYKEMDAGHFFPKTDGLAIYFHEDNIHAQCDYCNRYKHGNLYYYEKALRDKIGDKAIKELERLSRTTKKFTIAEYQAMIDYYNDQVDFLKETRLM